MRRNAVPKPPFSYVSIDLETGGLSDDCSVVEFGAVVDIPGVPLANLPTYSYIVGNTKLVFEPYALGMHKDLMDKIVEAGESAEKGEMSSIKSGTSWWGRCPSYMLARHFKAFLCECGWDGESTLTAAGKNFAGFDNMFLKKLVDLNGVPFTDIIPFHHRTLDIGSRHFDYATGKIPSLEQITSNPAAHTALADAMDVVHAVRKSLGVTCPPVAVKSKS